MTSATVSNVVTTAAVIGTIAMSPTASPAQTAGTPYPERAPIEQYRMTDSAEIALARTAAPASISADAEILVLGATGYQRAVAGKSGFVCLVERSWGADAGAAEFWNPKVRSPVCFNLPAVRSVLKDYLARTRHLLSGDSRIKPLPNDVGAPQPGAMAYMLSRNGYLGDDVGGPWHPHVMFFESATPATTWGANVDGSPVFKIGAHPTTFGVVVARWSDGTKDSTSTN